MPFFVSMPAKEGGYWIRFEYDPEMVQRIKRLPPDSRRWDPEMHAWWVHSLWYETAKSLLDDRATYSDYRRCHNNQRPDDPQEERKWQNRQADEARRCEEEARQRVDDWFHQYFSGSGNRSRGNSFIGNQDRSIPDCFAKLYLLSTAPSKVVTAAWKALCLIHHPDIGGSVERMKEINLAYEEALRISESRAAK